jgi:hypothetical protein
MATGHQRRGCAEHDRAAAGQQQRLGRAFPPLGTVNPIFTAGPATGGLSWPWHFGPSWSVRLHSWPGPVGLERADEPAAELGLFAYDTFVIAGRWVPADLLPPTRDHKIMREFTYRLTYSRSAARWCGP